MTSGSLENKHFWHHVANLRLEFAEDFLHYHPFKIITRIKLSFSNYLGCYSYSFRARQELIAVTVTVLWV